MASRSLCGGAVATGAVECMQPDRASAVMAAMIGSRNARVTRTGAIPSHETTLDLHPLWLTNRFLLVAERPAASRTRGNQAVTPAPIGPGTPVPPSPQKRAG